MGFSTMRVSVFWQGELYRQAYARPGAPVGLGDDTEDIAPHFAQAFDASWVVASVCDGRRVLCLVKGARGWLKRPGGATQLLTGPSVIELKLNEVACIRLGHLRVEVSAERLDHPGSQPLGSASVLRGGLRAGMIVAAAVHAVVLTVAAVAPDATPTSDEPDRSLAAVFARMNESSIEAEGGAFEAPSFAHPAWASPNAPASAPPLLDAPTGPAPDLTAEFKQLDVRRRLYVKTATPFEVAAMSIPREPRPSPVPPDLPLVAVPAPPGATVRIRRS